MEKWHGMNISCKTRKGRNLKEIERKVFKENVFLQHTLKTF